MFIYSYIVLIIMSLLVLFIASLLLACKSDLIYRIGEVVTLHCQTTHQVNIRVSEVIDFNISIFWRLPNGTKKETLTTSTLTINNITSSDAGIYECHVTFEWTLGTGDRNLSGSVYSVAKEYLRMSHFRKNNTHCFLDIFSTYVEAFEGNDAVWHGYGYNGKISPCAIIVVPKNTENLTEGILPLGVTPYRTAIENVKVQNSGQYKICVFARKTNESEEFMQCVTLSLKVKKRRRVEMELKLENNPLISQSSTMTCKADWAGSTVVSFLEQDCISEKKCWGTLKPFISIGILANFTKQISINWPPLVSKVIACEEKMREEQVRRSKNYLCRSDSHDTFSFGPFFKIEDGNELSELSSNNIEEGDDIMLTCQRSFCKSVIVTPHLKWSFFKSMDHKPLKVKNIFTVGVSSIRADVVIWDAKPEHSGIYACEGDPYIRSKSIQITVSGGEGFLQMYLSPLYVVIGLAFFALPIVYFRRQKRLEVEFQHNMEALRIFQKGNLNAIQSDVPLYQQADLLPFDREWEFPREKLTLGRSLGEGFFGKVLEGVATGIMTGENQTTVAVKTTKRNANKEEVLALEKELKIMSNLGCHPHVVNLLGAVVDRIAQNDLMLIVEYCHHGNLLTYMQQNRHRFGGHLVPTANDAQSGHPEYRNTKQYPFNIRVLLQWSYQIACGMEWLANKNILHCDLAARNILLTEENTAKICDFGLAHDLYSKEKYIKKKNCKIPVKWMAIESVEDLVFTSQSDVWSFGVVLWELFSTGKAPYQGFESFRDTWEAIRGGYRLEKPEHSTDGIYSVMKSCWLTVPSERPTFKVLASFFREHIDKQQRCTEGTTLKGEHVQPVPKTDGAIYMPTSGRQARRPTMMDRVRSLTFSGKPRQRLASADTDAFTNRERLTSATGSNPNSKSVSAGIAVKLPPASPSLTIPNSSDERDLSATPEYFEVFEPFRPFQNQQPQSPEYVDTTRALQGRSENDSTVSSSLGFVAGKDALLKEELRISKLPDFAGPRLTCASQTESELNSTNSKTNKFVRLINEPSDNKMQENHYIDSPGASKRFTPVIKTTSNAVSSFGGSSDYLDPHNEEISEYLDLTKEIKKLPE